METLSAQIRRARRRLILQQFVGWLPSTCFVGLSIAAAAILAGKLWPPAAGQTIWAVWWLAGGMAAGLVAAGICTALWPRTRLDAAYEIDRRFGLKERVSTAAGLTSTELATPAGEAVLLDAAERVGRLRVADQFGVRPGRRAWLPLLPAVLAIGCSLLIPGRGVVAPAVAAARSAEASQVKAAAKNLGKRLEQKQAEAKEKGLQDADDLLRKLADGTRKLSEPSQTDPKKALLELNDLSKSLLERRDKLAAGDQLKQQFNQLKDLDRGPAEKFGQAIKNGDLKRAMEEIKKIEERLAGGKVGQKEREQLAEQLERLQQNLKKVAGARQEAHDELAKQISQQRQAGHQREAERLQQQLDQMERQRQQEEQMADMAQSLSQAGKCLKQGDAQGAREALEALSDELGHASQASEELAMLDEALEQIGEAKASMNCRQCQGTGCKACQGKHGGPGIGRGHDSGRPPGDKIKAGLYDSRVAQNVRRGAAVIAGEADGPNRKGDVHEAIKEEFSSARHEAADPLTSQRLPRDYREHAKKYFEAVRDGRN